MNISYKLTDYLSENYDKLKLEPVYRYILELQIKLNSKKTLYYTNSFIEVELYFFVSTYFIFIHFLILYILNINT